MKPLNFITQTHPITKQAHESFKRWSFISGLLIIGAVTCIVILEIKQLYTFFTLKSEHDILTTYIASQKEILKKRKALTQEYQDLLDKQNRLADPDRLPHNVLLLIAELIPHDSYLTECVYIRKKRVILKGISQNSASLTRFFRTLSQHDKIPYATLNRLEHKSKSEELIFEIYLDL